MSRMSAVVEEEEHCCICLAALDGEQPLHMLRCCKKRMHSLCAFNTALWGVLEPVPQSPACPLCRGVMDAGAALTEHASRLPAGAVGVLGLVKTIGAHIESRLTFVDARKVDVLKRLKNDIDNNLYILFLNMVCKEVADEMAVAKNAMWVRRLRSGKIV